MALLYRCTRNGVTVGFLLPSAAADSDVMSLRRTGKPTPQDALPFPLRRSEAWGALARARIGALSELFPDWRIWLDQRGWHARRREAVYLQGLEPGVPAFSVHAESSTELAKQLYGQQAADRRRVPAALGRVGRRPSRQAAQAGGRASPPSLRGGGGEAYQRCPYSQRPG